jgi:phosphatidylserine/phosphatidylglycerophosphate/cardiolipin synthase-like enzyme
MKRVSFIVELATGGVFLSTPLRLLSQRRLQDISGQDVRSIVVEDGGPSMTHEANFTRLSQIAARGWEEQLAFVDGRTASVHSEFMMIQVVDGVLRNLPDGASGTLRALVTKAAALPAGTTQVPVSYAGPAQEVEPTPVSHTCQFDPSDLVIGGSVQRQILVDFVTGAHRRVVIHSTFLDQNRFRDLFEEIRTACQRGVTFDLLWGAEPQDGEENRNTLAAIEIARLVREDRDVSKRFNVHMRTTGSHAKVLLADKPDGRWIAAVGSCNWLSSPFRAVELTAVLRDPHVVADVATAIQRIVGRRGLSDDIATEMALVARDLRQHPPVEGSASLSIVLGDGHDVLMRTASGIANQRMLIGSHRLGSTARPGVVMQGETAADRANVAVTLLYTQSSGPLKNRHARKLAEEAAANGIRLVKVGSIPLHGKFLAWDDNDFVVTSLNWASAASDLDFPQADIGVHICASKIVTHVVPILEQTFGKLHIQESSVDV